jgi:hypothetical protein
MASAASASPHCGPVGARFGPIKGICISLIRLTSAGARAHWRGRAGSSQAEDKTVGAGAAA